MNKVLESENLLFVKVDEKYVNDYLKMLNDEEIQKLIQTKKKVYTKEDEIEWVKEKLLNNRQIS